MNMSSFSVLSHISYLHKVNAHYKDSDASNAVFMNSIQKRMFHNFYQHNMTMKKKTKKAQWSAHNPWCIIFAGLSPGYDVVVCFVVKAVKDAPTSAFRRPNSVPLSILLHRVMSSEILVPACEVVRGRWLIVLRIVIKVGCVYRRLDLHVKSWRNALSDF